MDKAETRALALKKRNALTEEERKTKSRKIMNHLESMELFKVAETILFYYSHNSEVETHNLMEKWIDRKKVLLPRLEGDSTFIALRITSLEDLRPNHFGIPEPMGSESKSLKPDLIIVPGVVFDLKGNRIGMGKGYYDRFLAGQDDVPRVALAYSEQILESVPKETYDEAVDWIITEDELIRC